MGFDISRSTFNSWNDYLGVVMQQGRVHQDSDWNELIDEFLRRLQAGALDAIGLCGVPSTTPQAFQIGFYTDQLPILPTPGPVRPIRGPYYQHRIQ